MTTNSITTTTAVPSIVSCYACHKTVDKADAWAIRLIVPTGRYHEGLQIWRPTGETGYECKTCIASEIVA